MSQPLTLSINGMHCGACVRRVTMALDKTPGVQVEDVQIGTARVAYDPAQTSPEQIAAAINKTGFDAQPAGR